MVMRSKWSASAPPNKGSAIIGAAKLAARMPSERAESVI